MENVFPDQPNPEQQKTWGGVGILGAVRDVSDGKR